MPSRLNLKPQTGVFSRGRVFLAGCLLLGVALPASGLPEKTLEELVSLADHIVIGKISKVDMVDTNDQQVFDIDKKTGLGSGNTLRLHVKVLTVVTSTHDQVPDTLVIPLWRLWENSLGEVKDDLLFETAIVLLKGDELVPVYPTGFLRGLHEGPSIEALLEQKTKSKTNTKRP